MSRVQCLECGTAVVVDPTGVCPEGHTVGSAGVRVARAMGDDSPHPDEPEPWVATVVLDDAEVRPATRERTIRPVSVAGADAATEQESNDTSDHESMLRELHALGDLHDGHPSDAVPQIATDAPGRPASGDQRPNGPGAASASAAATSPSPLGTPPPPVATPPATPTPPAEQVAQGFAELSALEAAFHALGYDEEATLRGEDGTSSTQPQIVTDATGPAAQSTPPLPAAPAGPSSSAATDSPPAPVTDPSDDLADLAELFAEQATPAAESTTRPMSVPDHHRVDESPGAPTGDPSTPTPVGPPARSTPPAPAASAPAPPAPAPAPAASAHTAPAQVSADGPPPRSADSTVDIANFTARGGKVGAGRGGRRKRFGR